MSIEWFSEIERALIGRACTVVRRKFNWRCVFEGVGNIALSMPWRIVANGRVALASADDGHQFGLPAPVDAEASADSLIAARSVTSLSVDAVTSDLAIHFGDTVRLDAFTNSSGYEGWQIALTPANGGMIVVSLGGGGVAAY